MAKNVIDAYLAHTPEPHRSTLKALRKTIHAALPHAEECLAYGFPAFKMDGTGVAGFAAYKDHCSYFPMSGSVLAALKKDLGKYSCSKGALQFPVDKTLSPALVKKLIKTRLAEVSVPPRNGAAHAYYENGVLQSKGAFKGGAMHGAWEWFRKDGTRMRSGSFRKGAQVGTWRTWDRHGQLVKETVFDT